MYVLLRSYEKSRIFLHEYLMWAPMGFFLHFSLKDSFESHYINLCLITVDSILIFKKTCIASASFLNVHDFIFTQTLSFTWTNYKWPEFKRKIKPL